MTKIVPRLCAMVAAMAMAAGLGGIAIAQQPAAPAPGGQGAGNYAQPDQASDSTAGPAGANRPLEQPVLYVTGVEVLSTTVGPKLDVIRVTGLASSQGWSGPTLVPFYYGKPGDDVLDLQFIATSPQQSQKAEGFVPISAVFEVDESTVFKGVRVRAGANAIELKQIPGKATVQIKAIDGKGIVGKKFVEKGTAGPDVVTAQELPKGFRTIMPTHGVAGIVHNPNRLNLILGDDGKIEMAFWE